MLKGPETRNSPDALGNRELPVIMARWARRGSKESETTTESDGFMNLEVNYQLNTRLRATCLSSPRKRIRGTHEHTNFAPSAP